MEDTFSAGRQGTSDGSGGKASNEGDASGGNEGDGERWGEADEASLARLPAAHLLLCSPVPNRPQTGTCPGPGG